MSSRMTLQDFLKRVNRVYKSVDIRTVAIRSNGIWQNALTVIRFSYRQPEYVGKEQKGLENKWGKVRTTNFRIEMQVWAFESLKTLCSQFLKEGKLLLLGESEDLQLGRSIDLFSLEGRFERYGYTRRDVCPWPFFEAFEGTRSPLLDKEELQSEVKSQTLFDLYPAICDLLGIDFAPNVSFDLVVTAPFYAAIEHVNFGEQRCKVRIKFHKDIEALEVNAVVRRGEQYNSPLRDRARSIVNLEASEESGEYMRLWTKALELPDARPTDYLCVSLVQTKPSALDIGKSSYVTQISRLLESKEPAKTPLLRALRRFVTEDELEQYLTKPTEAPSPYKKGKRDASATFELGVTWLLGLCGFSIIWLGQTKHESLKEERITRFGADILAYYEAENTVVLVGCTIGIPKDDDIDNLKSVRKVLLDEIFKDTRTQVEPFVFSAAPELSNKDRDGSKLLDAGDIRGILNYVRQGEVSRALSNYFGFPFKPRA